MNAEQIAAAVTEARRVAGDSVRRIEALGEAEASEDYKLIYKNVALSVAFKKEETDEVIARLQEGDLTVLNEYGGERIFMSYGNPARQPKRLGDPHSPALLQNMETISEDVRLVYLEIIAIRERCRLAANTSHQQNDGNADAFEKFESWAEGYASDMEDVMSILADAANGQFGRVEANLLVPPEL